MNNLSFNSVRAQVKELFFDRQKVVRAMDEGTRKVLSKFGAFVRTRSRTSMRTRRGSAPAGKPPNAHTRLLKDAIFFSYEPDNRNVVIGPVPLASHAEPPGEGAELLEYGGTVVRKKNGKRVKQVYAGNPYMHPAFDYVKDQELPDLWRNSIK